MPVVGVLNDYTESDPVGQAQLAAFRDELGKLGWTNGRNMRIDYRTGAADSDAIRTYAAEIIATRPDVVLAAGATITAALQRASRSVPIVFVAVVDPVGSGFVANLARPGGNATGFTNFEYGLSGKWLKLLNQVAPRVTRAAIMRDPTSPTGTGQFGAIQSVAPALGIEVRPLGMSDAREIERAVAAFAHSPNSGLIVTGSALAQQKSPPQKPNVVTALVNLMTGASPMGRESPPPLALEPSAWASARHRPWAARASTARALTPPPS